MKEPKGSEFVMDKRKTVLGVILLLLLFCAGCGKEETVSRNDTPTTIVVWHYYNAQQKEVFDRLVSQFNRTVGAEKGIYVTAESKGEVDTLAKEVLAAAKKEIGAEEMPDIFASYVDTVNTIFEMGMLTDISQYMTGDELAEYIPSFLEEGMLAEGELQVFPIAKSTELLYLNKTDWDKFAAESGHELEELSTWEGILQVAEDYYNWSGGKVFFGRDAEANFMYVGCHQLGEDIYRVENGECYVEFSEEALRKIWECYAVPYIKGYYGAYGRFRSDDVKTGDLIACVSSTASAAYFPTEVVQADGSTYPIEGMVLPLPDFEGTDACGVQQGAGMAVTKSEESKEQAAVEFLKWFTDVEQNVTFCAESGYFPVKKGEAVTEQLKESLKEQGIAEVEFIYQNMIEGIEAVNKHELYTPPVVEGGENYRSMITSGLTDALEQYKESYAVLEPDSQEQFLEQCFQEWMTELKQKIQ